MTDTSSDSGFLPTIVLARRGLNPNVHLQVFDQEFHAHSMILKTNSDFFRSFFDSADKTLPASEPRFKYMWVTKVDDDGTWSLVWEHAKVGYNGPHNHNLGLHLHVSRSRDKIPLVINYYSAIYTCSRCSFLLTVSVERPQRSERNTCNRRSFSDQRLQNTPVRNVQQANNSRVCCTSNTLYRASRLLSLPSNVLKSRNLCYYEQPQISGIYSTRMWQLARNSV